jgi:hypothetical protein
VLHVVNAANPPVARDDAATTEANSAVTLNPLANDSDPDGGALRVITTVPGEHGQIVWNGDGTLTYTPDPNYIGTDRFVYVVADEHGLTAQAAVTITIVVVNRPPIVTDDAVETKTRTDVLIGVAANDFDPEGKRLVVTAVGTPSGGTAWIHRGESVGYSPGANFAGIDTFTYTVSDGPGRSFTANVKVTVLNAAPLPRSETLAAPEDTAVGYQAFNVLANDTDPDGDELHIVDVEQPQFGTFMVSPDKQQFSYRSAANWSGIDTFHYTVSDPFGARVRVRSQIGVSAVNDSPVAVNDSFSVYKNQLLTITQAQIVGNDTDVEGHTITIFSVGAPTNGTAVKLANGSVEYQPFGEFTGTDSFEYTIEDSGGGAFGSGRVTITVRPDARPVAAFTVTCTDLACAFDASASTDDRGIVTYQWLLGNGGTASGKSFNYTYPAAGSFTVRLTVTDAINQSTATTKPVTVTQPNAPPVPKNDAFSTPEDLQTGFMAGNLLANDTDPEGGALTITAVTLPANGTLTFPPDFSTFVFKGNANWSGVTSFTYTVRDPKGATAQAFVQLTVTAVNDSPVVNADAHSVFKNQVLTLTPAQLLANDTDVEGHALSIHLIGSATNGTATLLANGSIEYRPFGEYVGTDFFEYTVRDAGGAFGSGRVNLTVLQDNRPVPAFTVTCAGRVCSFDASASTDDRGIVLYQWLLGNGGTAAGKTFTYTYPVAGVFQPRLTVQDTLGQTASTSKFLSVTEPPPDAKDDSFTWRKGFARFIEYSAMLANDTDPNNDTLSVASVDSSQTMGTVSCDSTGCVFTPPSSFWTGQTTFRYTVSDGHGQSDTATVTINFTF